MFPIAMKVAAQTVGLDLVSVKPMSAPKNNLFYVDYQYGNTKRTTRKKKINNIFKINE
jgi:translation initiation factor IF-3